jgi:hypothetical protein
MANPNQGGVTNDMLKAVGREQGPDYMLKLLPEHDPGNTDGLTFIDDGAANNVINMTSSITEVLNVVSYLCSTTRDGTLIDTNNSVPSTIGEHGAGLYANAGAIGETFIQSANPGAPADPLFDIVRMVPTANVANAVIPVGILRRTGPSATANISWGVLRAAPLATAVNVIPIMSDCVKQMINILVKTREIFGPKGWTDLFQKVKGGGGSHSKHAKRTHRQHRRRYSSKQY